MAGTGEKKSYSTQQLLSMNMDRLKEHMQKMGQPGLDSNMGPSAATAPSPRKRRSSRFVRPTTQRHVLLVKPDTMLLSEFISANDERPLQERFQLAWADDFGGALKKMSDREFRVVLVFAGVDRLPEIEKDLTTVDFLLLINGMANREDQDFLLKKRAFVKFLVPGGSDAEKITTFRMLKEGYRSRPFLYLHDGRDARILTMAQRIHGVTAVRSGAGLAPQILTATFDLLK